MEGLELKTLWPRSESMLGGEQQENKPRNVNLA